MISKQSIISRKRGGTFKATKSLIHKAVIAAAVSGLFFAPGIHETNAAFTTNFNGVGVTGGTYDKNNSGGSGNYYVDFSCNMSYTVVSGINSTECGGTGSTKNLANNHDDKTPFFQGLFIETGTNKKYFHVIIGDKLKAGQARNEMTFEYIMEATTTNINSGLNSASYANDSSTNNIVYNQTRPFNSAQDIRNANGSGNPTRVIMNQILYNDDGTVNTQYLKGLQGGTVAFNQATGRMTITGGTIVFDSKPIITQFANDGGMYNQFTIDMRHKSYSDGTQMSDAEANGPNGKITNITNLLTGGGFANPAADSGDYDTTNATFTAHYTNNSNPNYTAGAYTYTPHATAAYFDLGGGGSYSYDIAATTFVETGFVPWTPTSSLDWTDFCDPTINPDWHTSSANTINGPLACTDGTTARRGKGSKGW